MTRDPKIVELPGYSGYTMKHERAACPLLFFVPSKIPEETRRAICERAYAWLCGGLNENRLN